MGDECLMMLKIWLNFRMSLLFILQSVHNTNYIVNIVFFPQIFVTQSRFDFKTPQCLLVLRNYEHFGPKSLLCGGRDVISEPKF